MWARNRLEPKLKVWGHFPAPWHDHAPRLEGSWAHTSSHHPYACTRNENREHTGQKELWPALVWVTEDKHWGKNPEEPPSCCPDVVPAELGGLLLRTPRETIALTAVTLSLGTSPCRSLGLCPSLLNQDDDGAFLPVGEINSLSCRAHVPIVQIKTTYVGLRIPINSAFASAPYLMHSYATKKMHENVFLSSTYGKWITKIWRKVCITFLTNRGNDSETHGLLLSWAWGICP